MFLFVDEEEVDIERCVQDDCSRVSVKILRKVIPKLRIACYYSDEQVSGKRKCKPQFAIIYVNNLEGILIENLLTLNTVRYK